MMTPILTLALSADGFCWNQYSDRVATITNDLRYFATVAYFAFDSWDDAHAFWKHITDHRLCSRAQVRESERFTTHDWEVKTWGMPQAVLEKLLERDRSRSLPLPQVRRDWSVSDSHSSIQYEAA
jgi:hypothetical protein